MSGSGAGPQRVGLRYAEHLVETLSPRDWAIISTLERVRLASGTQLERLHFSNLAGRSRSIMRWRVLKRLTDDRILLTLDRRIGAARHGSDQLRYALDSAGIWLVRWRDNIESFNERVRRPRVPGERFVAHTLAVTELFVQLCEQTGPGRGELVDFETEAMAWRPDGLGGFVKPDALVKLRRGSITDHWWYEADLPRHDSDLANESLPVIQKKLHTYLDFVRRGQYGPDGMVPRVMFGVPTARRRAAIQSLVKNLPEPAAALFVVAGLTDAAHVMVNELQKE